MYVLTNGKTYLKTNTETTVHRSLAITFKTQEKADNYKLNLKKSLQHLGFYSVKLDELPTTESQENKTNIAFVQHYELGDIDLIVYQFEEMMININDRTNYLTNALKQVNMKITDIEHKAELEPPLDMYKGYLLYKELHETRKKRRAIKDELEKIKYISENTLSDWKSHKVSNRIAGLSSRQYTPRIKNELFEQEGVENR